MARSKKRDASSVQTLIDAAFQARAVEGNNQDSSEVAAMTVGIRLPYLCQRVLFQRSSFPFSRTTVVYGQTGSNKSSLVYYFYDLFLDAGGRYFHLDVEDKDTPQLRLSLTKYRKDKGECRSCTTLNDYQIEVESYLNWYKAVTSKKDGPGKACPIVIGIDSLVAKMTEEAANKVAENHGVTGRRFANEAMALNDWFKYIPGKLAGMPICLLGVNHDKPTKHEVTGQTVHRTPGGAAPGYFSTYKIYAERVKQLKQTVSGREGNRIKLVMHKNSLGPDGQSVEVEIAWTHKAVQSMSGKTTVKQHTRWDWPKATTEHLYRMQGLDGGKKLGKRGQTVRDLLDLRKSGGKYHSKLLGVAASEPLNARAMGLLIETRADILAQLEPELGVCPSSEYRPEEDYDVQLEEARARAADFMPDTSVPDTDDDDTEDDDE